MFRFFPAILLIQIITAGLIFALIKGEFENQLLIILAVFWMIISMLASFWFSSMANHVHKDALAKTVDEHAKEREKIRVNAERQKTKALKNSHQEILKESRRANRKANMKVGSILIFSAAVGGVMLFTQFITAGLLIMGTAGGGLAGYLGRMRQEKKSTLISQSEAETAQPRLINKKDVNQEEKT